MPATWTFCSRDGFEYVELINSEPSMARRYFDWRDTVGASTGVPASCRLEADLTPRHQDWIEMKDMSSSSASTDSEDIQLEAFDTCGCEGEPAGRETRREGLMRGVRSLVEFLGRTLAIGRR